MILTLFIIGEAIYGCLFVQKKNTESVVIGLLNMSVFFFTVVIGFILNFSIRPMFIPRYVFPALGLFWFGIFEILDQMPEYKKMAAILLAGILCYVAVSAYPKRLAQEYETGTQATVAFIDQNIPSNDTIIGPVHISGPLEYYFPRRHLITVLDDTTLNSCLSKPNKKTYWYFTPQKTAADDQAIQQNGYKASEIYSGNIDNETWFNCYELVPEK